MELEEKIKKLENQLELKKAFLEVSISFGKGNKFSKATKEQVITFVKEACLQASEGYSMTSTGGAFTDEEVNILKRLVQSVKARADGVSQPTPQTPLNGTNERSSIVSNKIRQIKENQAKRQARLLLLDNVEQTVRKQLEPNSVVEVMGKAGNMCIAKDAKGVKFQVPEEDLEFINQ